MAKLRLSVPDIYLLRFNRSWYKTFRGSLACKFSTEARAPGMKLYAFVSRGRLVYIGITSRDIKDRLYDGWKGSYGYSGYKIREKLKHAQLWIWRLTGVRGKKKSRLEAETIEAEVVFACRSRGRWPQFQTEIHFRPPKPMHTRLALAILDDIALVRGR